MTAIPDVTHDAAERRFEIHTPSGTAVLQYAERDGELDFLHTEVPDELEGQGYGAALAKRALEFAREKGVRVIPSCPFVASYVRRHKEYASLVAH